MLTGQTRRRLKARLVFNVNHTKQVMRKPILISLVMMLSGCSLPTYCQYICVETRYSSSPFRCLVYSIHSADSSWPFPQGVSSIFVAVTDDEALHNSDTYKIKRRNLNRDDLLCDMAPYNFCVNLTFELMGARLLCVRC